jgi:hypothetical protein
MVMNNGPHPVNGTLLKVLLAVLTGALTLVIAVVGWAVPFMFETRSIGAINTATAAANTAAIGALQSELHQIALEQARRTAVIERLRAERR